LIAFADSSALVKLYASEADDDVVRALGAVDVSELCLVEVTSALWRKHRGGTLSREETATLVRRLQADLSGTDAREPRFVMVPLASPMLRDAAGLTGVHPIAAGDAIQLASALAARRADPECRTFACFDRRLRAAAAAEGFAVVP
jgi:uncharacterized protein